MSSERLGVSRGFDQSKALRVHDSLPDITSYDTFRQDWLVHSDGVGLIRKEVLEDVVKQIPFGAKYKKDISAVQIRYGGAKGGELLGGFVGGI